MGFLDYLKEKRNEFQAGLRGETDGSNGFISRLGKGFRGLVSGSIMLVGAIILAHGIPFVSTTVISPIILAIGALDFAMGVKNLFFPTPETTARKGFWDISGHFSNIVRSLSPVVSLAAAIGRRITGKKENAVLMRAATEQHKTNETHPDGPASSQPNHRKQPYHDSTHAHQQGLKM